MNELFQRRDRISREIVGARAERPLTFEEFRARLGRSGGL